LNSLSIEVIFYNPFWTLVHEKKKRILEKSQVIPWTKNMFKEKINVWHLFANLEYSTVLNQNITCNFNDSVIPESEKFVSAIGINVETLNLVKN